MTQLALEVCLSKSPFEDRALISKSVISVSVLAVRVTML